MEVEQVHNIHHYDFGAGLAKFFAENKEYLDFGMGLNCIVRLSYISVCPY